MWLGNYSSHPHIIDFSKSRASLTKACCKCTVQKARNSLGRYVKQICVHTRSDRILKYLQSIGGKSFDDFIIVLKIFDFVSNILQEL